MAWVRPELTELITRIESDITSRLTSNATLLRRAMLKILARVLAGGVHILHGFLSYLSRQFIVTTAEASYLDDIARSWNVSREAATFATGSTVFTGTIDTIIPEGTVVVRDDGVEYTTTEEGSISSESETATIALVCSVTGSIGDADEHTTLTLQSPIDGIEDSTDVPLSAIGGGADLETDSHLRTRVLARIQSSPTGGSVADYISWARSISGVDGVWVKSVLYGLGTVGVIITKVTTDPTDPIASAPLIAEVQTYIDTVRPVTATVFVQTVTPLTVDLSIQISPNNSALRDQITANLADLFKSDGAPGENLLLSHLQEAIATSGVKDSLLSAIVVDGGSVAVANVEFTGLEYPVLGDLSFSTL